MNLFSSALPRTLAEDWRNPSVPPTSSLLRTTPGMTRAIDHTSVRFGSVSSVSREMTVCLTPLDVSSSGDVPLTVMASSTAPISSLKSARDTWSELTAMRPCSMGRKPCSSAFTA